MSGEAILSPADWLWNNPEFKRLARSKMRPRSMLLYGTISLLFFGGGLVAGFFIARYNLMKISEMLKVYFFVCVSIQVAVVSLYGLNLATQNIVLERERFTFDFQRMVTMGPVRMTLGKIFGASIEAWFIVLCSMPFLAISVWAGGLPIWVGVQAVILVLVWGTFVCALGLAASAYAKKSNLAHGMAFLFGGVFFALAVTGTTLSDWKITLWSCWNPVMFLIGLGEYFRPPNIGPTVSFLGYDEIPMIAGMLAMVGFFTALMFAMIVRRLTDSELSMLSPRFAGLTFVVLQILLIGGMAEHMNETPYRTLTVFHAVSGDVLVLLAFALTPSAEMLYARLHRAKPNQHWAVLGEIRNRLEDNPPLMFIGLLATLYAVLAMGMAYLCSDGLDGKAVASFLYWNAALSVMWVFAALAMAALLLYIQVYTESGGLRAGTVILILIASGPPLALAILGMPENIPYVNPAGLMVYFANGPVENFWHQDYGAMSSMPLICIAAAVPLVILCGMRIRYLLDIHQIELQKMINEAAAEDMELPRLQAAAREAAAKALAQRKAAAAAVPATPAASESAKATPVDENLPAEAPKPTD